jgi:hypothetical protein
LRWRIVTIKDFHNFLGEGKKLDQEKYICCHYHFFLREMVKEKVKIEVAATLRLYTCMCIKPFPFVVYEIDECIG